MGSYKEKNEFAFSHPKMYEKTFILSKHVKDKEKEVFIVEYEDVYIEVFRTLRNEDPLAIYINGEFVEQVNKNKKSILEFSSKFNKHKLYVWNARARNFFFSSFIFRNGIAITIDDIPVKDTLADPLLNLAEGKTAIYIFLALIVLKAILTLFIQSSEDGTDQAIGSFLIYGIFVIGLILAVAIFNKNPRASLWIGLILGGMETIDFLYSYFSVIHKQSAGLLIWGSLRIGALFAIGRSLKALEAILKIKISDITLSKKPTDISQIDIPIENNHYDELEIPKEDNKRMEGNMNSPIKNDLKKSAFSKRTLFFLLSIGLIITLVVSGFYFYNYHKASQYFQQAMELKKQNKLIEASKKLEEVILYNKNFPNVYIEIGDIYFVLYDENKRISDSLGISSFGEISLDKIEMFYKKQLEIDSSNFESYMRLRKLYFDRATNRYEANKNYYFQRTIYICDQIIAKDSAKKVTYYIKGLSHLLLGEYDKSIASFYKAMQFQKDFSDAYGTMGWAYFELKNYPKAIENFEKAINTEGKVETPFEYLSMKKSAIYFYLGSAYFNLGDKVKQKENYLKSAKMGYPDAINWCKSYGLSYD